MADESIFKTATFGFNKTDVMNYIEALKEKEAALIAQFEEAKRQIEQQAEENAGKYTEKIRELVNELNKYAARLSETEKENEEVRRAFREYTQNLESGSPDATANASAQIAQSRISALEKELEEKNKLISSQAERLALLEANIASDGGAAVAAAPPSDYPEELIRQAQEKVSLMTGEISLFIKETAGKIGSLSAEVDSSRQSVNSALEQLGVMFGGLSETLGDIASQLGG